MNTYNTSHRQIKTHIDMYSVHNAVKHCSKTLINIHTYSAGSYFLFQVKLCVQNLLELFWFIFIAQYNIYMYKFMIT